MTRPPPRSTLFPSTTLSRSAPAELRAVHPAPPGSIQFRGKEINIAGVDNPLRKDVATFKRNVAAGGGIYVRSCMFCHGGNLDGHRLFPSAPNPPPAHFEDPRALAMLQAADPFLPIGKGG